jgi:hypothetical protein
MLDGTAQLSDSAGLPSLNAELPAALEVLVGGNSSIELSPPP